MNNEKGTLDRVVNQPRTLFKPRSWLTKIDFINHLVLFNNVLITVLSEKEGGKTTFGTLLINNLNPQIKSVAMKIKSPCSRENILKELAIQLDLNHETHNDFTSIIGPINEKKEHVLLIIDEAQYLPEALIKEILTVIKTQDSYSFFHVCLITDYSLSAVLNNLAVESFNGLIHTIEVGALTESEARTYILQRAMTTGLINKPLSDIHFKQFYQLTQGNLAKINSNLELFITKCSVQKNKKQLSNLKNTSFIVSALAVAFIGYVYMFPVQTSVSDKPILEEPPKLLPSSIASWQDSATVQLVQYALPKKQILDDTFSEEQDMDTTAVIDKVLVIPKIDPPKKIATNPVANMSKPKQLVTLNPPVSKKIVKPRLKSVNNFYTIQLIASHKIEEVNRFKKINKITAKTTIRRFINGKNRWYVLTLGEYKNRAQAQQEINKLPASLAKLNPWVRSSSNLS